MGRDTITKMGVRRREFVTRNIIGNRVFGGSSIAFILLKVSRWSRNSSRPPMERITKNRTSWRGSGSMDRLNDMNNRQRRISKIRSSSSNVIRNKNRQILKKINKMFFKNSRINRLRGLG